MQPTTSITNLNLLRDMSAQALAQAHALLLQFLQLNGYTRTLAVFQEEAGPYLRGNAHVLETSPEMPLTQILDELHLSTIADKMKGLNLERDQDVDLNVKGDSHYPRFPIQTFTTIHANNILTVRMQTIPVLNTWTQHVENIPTIATGAADKTVKLTSLLTGETFRILEHHQAAVLSIDFHPHRPELMLTSSMDATAALVDVSASKVLQTWRDHSKYVVRAMFAPDGTSFATASYDRTVIFYKLAASSTSDSLQYEKYHVFGPFGGSVEALCYLPDSTTIVVGARGDNYLHYIDLATGVDVRYNMNANGDDWISFTPMHFSISPDGRYLLCSTDDRNGRLILFAVRSARQARNFYGAPTDAFSTPRHCWHPSGKYFFVTGDDWRIRVFDVAQGKVVDELVGHKAVVRGLWYDVERQMLASCGFDKTVRLWGSVEGEGQ